MSVAVVFFSKYCPHSEKFLGALKQSGQDSKISKFICVDKQKDGQRPKEVKACGILEVPTVICDAKVLPGIKAFKWLVERIKSVDSGNSSQVQDTRKSSGGRAVCGVEPASAFNGSGKYSGLTEQNVMAGSNPYQAEGSVEKNDDLLMVDDCISGGPSAGIPGLIPDEEQEVDVGKRDSLKAKQLTNAYNQLLMDRKS
jgi:hypothetical protein